MICNPNILLPFGATPELLKPSVLVGCVALGEEGARIISQAYILAPHVGCRQHLILCIFVYTTLYSYSVCNVVHIFAVR